jgi:hypothetical protein
MLLGAIGTRHRDRSPGASAGQRRGGYTFFGASARGTSGDLFSSRARSVGGRSRRWNTLDEDWGVAGRLARAKNLHRAAAEACCALVSMGDGHAWGLAP